MTFASIFLFSKLHKLMNDCCGEPLALFLAPDGNIYPDTLICSGLVPSELDGKPCPYSKSGRFPESVPLDPLDPTYSNDFGQPGDLCPPCAKQNLGNVGHWQGHGNQSFPPDLLSLRLFKCRMWFWLIIPGLHDHKATKVVSDRPDP